MQLTTKRHFGNFTEVEVSLIRLVGFGSVADCRLPPRTLPPLFGKGNQSPREAAEKLIDAGIFGIDDSDSEDGQVLYLTRFGERVLVG